MISGEQEKANDDNMKRAQDIVYQIHSLAGEWDLEEARYNELWDELRKILKEKFDINKISLEEEKEIMQENITEREQKMHNRQIEICCMYKEMLDKALEELRYIKDDLVHYGYMNEVRQKVLENITDLVWEVNFELQDERLYHASQITEARIKCYEKLM